MNARATTDNYEAIAWSRHSWERTGRPGPLSYVLEHASESCPAITESEAERVEAPGEDGWPCSLCIHEPEGVGLTSMLAKAHGIQGDSIDAPERHEGEGSGSRPANGATEKQLAFVRKLMAERGVAWEQLADIIDAQGQRSSLEQITKREASAAIDNLLAMPKAQAADEPASYRWTKHEGSWMVSGPRAEVGSEITVTKASGEEAQAIVTAIGPVNSWGDQLHEVRKAEEASSSAAAPLPDVPAGFYAIPSEGDNDLMFVRIDRPTEGSYAGRTFGQLIIGGHNDQRIPYAQLPTILERILEAGPEAAARLYGQEIGRCGLCNRTLTDEESRAYGIGPTCRNK